MPWCSPSYALEDAKSWIAGQSEAREMGSAFEFVITSSDGRCLGACGVNGIDRIN